jgi:hypothetical protein
MITPNLLVPMLTLVLGWLLGILGTRIISQIEKNSRRNEITKGAISELKTTRIMVALIRYSLTQKYGILNRDLIHWLKRIVDDYHGPCLERSIITEAVDKFSQLNDDQLNQLDKHAKLSMFGKEGEASSIKKINCPFLTSKIGEISAFNVDIQTNINELLFQINIFNQEVERSLFFFDKTFDSALSPANHEVIRTNVHRALEGVMRRSRRIADQITELIDVW